MADAVIPIPDADTTDEGVIVLDLADAPAPPPIPYLPWAIAGVLGDTVAFHF